MHLTDTHAHIYLPEFDADRKEMLQRAFAAGVTKIFMPNIDSSSIADMHATADAYPENCFPMMGLHPCSVKENYLDDLAIVEEHLAKNKYFGIGECGLDYYWDITFKEEQKDAFRYQVALAKKYQLPIIIHSRNSIDDCIALIEENKDENLRGIFHCFSGTAEQLEKIISLDFYAGIGGVVTFKNGGLDKILKPEHLSHLVLETDSPYLAPVPHRGKRNEPGYLEYVVTRLGEVLGVSEGEIAGRIMENTNKVFKI